MDKRKNNGGVRLNAGRKSKDEEQRLSKLLSPYVEGAIEKLVSIMDNDKTRDTDKLTAIKILFSYKYGSPKQQIEDITEKKLFGLDGDELEDWLNDLIKPSDD